MDAIAALDVCMARACHAGWCSGVRPRFLAPEEAIQHGSVQVMPPLPFAACNLDPCISWGQVVCGAISVTAIYLAACRQEAVNSPWPHSSPFAAIDKLPVQDVYKLGARCCVGQSLLLQFALQRADRKHMTLPP